MDSFTAVERVVRPLVNALSFTFHHFTSTTTRRRGSGGDGGHDARQRPRRAPHEDWVTVGDHPAEADELPTEFPHPRPGPAVTPAKDGWAGVRRL